MIKWINGPRYDYPEGYPYITETLWWDLNGTRLLEPHLIPKEYRRRRWIPGSTVFVSPSGERLKVDLYKGDHMPLKTVKYLIANDSLLKRLKRHN